MNGRFAQGARIVVRRDYGLLLDSGLSPAEIVKRVRVALRQIRLRRTSTARELLSPLVCFQR